LHTFELYFKINNCSTVVHYNIVVEEVLLLIFKFSPCPVPVYKSSKPMHADVSTHTVISYPYFFVRKKCGSR